MIEEALKPPPAKNSCSFLCEQSSSNAHGQKSELLTQGICNTRGCVILGPCEQLRTKKNMGASELQIWAKLLKNYVLTPSASR